MRVKISRRNIGSFWLLLLLLAGAGRSQAQQVRVSGSVSGAADRQPVPGTSIQIPRLHLGTSADAKGNFSIDAERTDTLVFRAVGFKPTYLPLGGTGLSQLVVQIRLVADSVQLSEMRIIADRPDRAAINRALRNMKRPVPPEVSQVKRPPRPAPLFPVDSTAPKAPVPTIANPVSLIYDQFSREGKQRRKMEELQAAEQAEKARQARARYNKAFKDNRGYER